MNSFFSLRKTVDVLICFSDLKQIVIHSLFSAAKPLWREPGAERPLVQILVGVASIQMRTLKTEVEKGSM